jgi:hypothetical protein
MSRASTIQPDWSVDKSMRYGYVPHMAGRAREIGRSTQ